MYSIYHQRAGRTSLFHMRGVDFTHFNTCCTFNCLNILCLPKPPPQPTRWDVTTHLIRHERRYRAPDLVVFLQVSLRPNHDEDEAGGDGNLRQVPQEDGLGETQKGQGVLAQEVNLPYKDVGGFGPRWDLLQEMLVELHDEEINVRKENKENSKGETCGGKVRASFVENVE